MNMNGFTHLNKNGDAVMVDVSEKPVTHRTASASGKIKLSPTAYDALVKGDIKKGDAIAAARIAGIMAVKKTAELIPLCHQLPVTGCTLEFERDDMECSVRAVCGVKTDGKTGVEMEALTGVSAALLTIYDMCKALDRSMVISDIRLEYKSGGRTGEFRRESNV